MNTTQSIATAADLDAIRYQSDLDHVEIETRLLKYRGLLPHAIKYGLWALKPGGMLLIRDSGPDSTYSWPWVISSNTVRQLAATLLHRDAELVRSDAKAREMQWKRTSEPPPPGWSAGVIFSGSDGEIPTLEGCLKGLLAQPELTGPEGEIVVCGPTRDLGFLGEFPTIRYLVYDPPPNPRFMVCRKKNFLIRTLTRPRVAVMHTRIVLQPCALGAVPREFDITTPLVRVASRLGPKPYLCYSTTDKSITAALPRRLPRTLRHVAPSRYLSMLDHGIPYVDGGIFLARRSLFEDCPLHDALAWAESEDVEWCARARYLGYLVDLAPDATADTQTNKLTGTHEFPDIVRRPIQWLYRLYIDWSGCARHRVGRLTGLR